MVSGYLCLARFPKNKRNFARTMNWTVIIIETLAMTAAFTAMVLIPLVKNPVWWIHDYPKDIQEEYFKSHERVPAEFFSLSLSVTGCGFSSTGTTVSSWTGCSSPT